MSKSGEGGTNQLVPLRTFENGGGARAHPTPFPYALDPLCKALYVTPWNVPNNLRN